VSAGDGREVSAIVCPSRYILTAGWSRVIRVYSDLPGHDDDDDGTGYCAGCQEQWEMAHDEDIMCMALLRPTTVVTASYDGDLIVWSLDNGQTVARFNADLDTGPLRSSRSSRRRSTYKATSVRRRHTMYVLVRRGSRRNRLAAWPRRSYFSRTLLCISAAYAVMWCLSVRPSRSWILSKRINIFVHWRVATPF